MFWKNVNRLGILAALIISAIGLYQFFYVTPAKKQELELEDQRKVKREQEMEAKEAQRQKEAAERELQRQREAEAKRKEDERKAAELADATRRQQEAAAIVELFENDHFGKRREVFRFGQNNENFNNIGFDNKASSARWNVPPGWRVVLYGDNTFRGTASKLVMEGIGETVDIEREKNIGDEGSSLRWERK